MAVIRVFVCENRNEVPWRAAGGSPVRQTTRAIHNTFDEHGIDVRDNLVALRPQRRHYQSTAIYDSPWGGHRVRRYSNGRRPAMVCTAIAGAQSGRDC